MLFSKNHCKFFSLPWLWKMKGHLFVGKEPEFLINCSVLVRINGCVNLESPLLLKHISLDFWGSAVEEKMTIDHQCLLGIYKIKTTGCPEQPLKTPSTCYEGVCSPFWEMYCIPWAVWSSHFPGPSMRKEAVERKELKKNEFNIS